MKLSVLERAERYIFPCPMTGCWLWGAAINRYGYGTLYVKSEAGEHPKKIAHRVLYEIFKKVKLTSDMHLDHLCRVRGCVNPDHLEIVTTSENTRRGRNHNREKVTCKQGHPFTYIHNGKRYCKVCKRAADKKWRQKESV